MKKTLILVSLLLTAGLLFAGGQKAAESGDGFSGNYAFGGSTTLEGFLRPAIDEFTSLHPGVTISYDAPGSSAGVKGALDGTYDLGAASRKIKDTEKSAGAIPVVVALDGVAVVVNKETVTIANLSMDQIKKVFSGEVTNWSALGGPNAEIVVVNRDEASGTRSAFGDIALGDAKFTDKAIITTGNGDMVAKVGSTPYAIGYCGFAYITRDPGIKAVTVEGVEPTMENVLSETFPIQRPLNMVHTGDLDEVEQAFLDFLLSDDGQAIIEEEGFISIK
ncbi:phosphate ABC transporter substrate-binding protein [Marispirochaeta sp.]|jgi:phosphate transport system substrate-binding protein|uniref:phosphate ABC transporter substrate-binding protein n=1 Tax=Marispirochaeta sp. TaxID=2038653 RepID=UPI0029C8F7C8|nr:phosphate ABC transporter substrate-binding protein [Marispirochaeta sp.]